MEDGTAISSEIALRSSDAISQAEAMTVANQEQFAAASEFLKNVKTLQKQVSESFDPIIEQAHKAHKEAIGQRDKFLKPLLGVEKTVKGKIGAYVDEQDRIRREADRKRIEAEMKEAELRRKAEIAEAKGKEKTAENFTRKADAVVIPPTPPPPPPKVEGVSFREVIEIEVIAPDFVPREFLIPDVAAIRDWATKTKGNEPIPGVKITKKKVPVVR